MTFTHTFTHWHERLFLSSSCLSGVLCNAVRTATSFQPQGATSDCHFRLLLQLAHESFKGQIFRILLLIPQIAYAVQHCLESCLVCRSRHNSPGCITYTCMHASQTMLPIAHTN